MDFKFVSDLNPAGSAKRPTTEGKCPVQEPATIFQVDFDFPFHMKKDGYPQGREAPDNGGQLSNRLREFRNQNSQPWWLVLYSY
jgi:hypothetical protein